MKKELTSLVYEALTKLHYTGLKGEVKEVLTSLATKASRNGLQPLPESPTEDFIFLIRGAYSAGQIWEYVIKHFGTKPAEWWQKLNKGDKFLDCNGISRLYNGVVFLGTDRSGTYEARLCSPYTEPTALEQFMATLTPEQRELAKSLTIQEGGGLEK